MITKIELGPHRLTVQLVISEYKWDTAEYSVYEELLDIGQVEDLIKNLQDKLEQMRRESALNAK